MANAMVPLANISVTSAATVTFSNIPSTYRDLRLVIQTVSASDGSYPLMTFNGDSGSNYSRVLMYGTGSTTGSLNNTTTNVDLGNPIMNTAVGNLTIDIMDYQATDKNKSVLSRSGGTTSSSSVMAGAYRWASNAAITTIAIACSPYNWVTGTTMALYGVKA